MKRTVAVWHDPNETPPQDDGTERIYIVAVRRAARHGHKPYVFKACYLDDYEIDLDDGGWTLVTGWYTCEEKDGESRYTPLLGAGDALVAWAEFPAPTDDPAANAVYAMLAAARHMADVLTVHDEMPDDMARWSADDHRRSAVAIDAEVEAMDEIVTLRMAEMAGGGHG